MARARSGPARDATTTKRCESWRGVWLDAGRRDEYFLDLGAIALRDALLAAGLPEDRLHFELFEGGHSGMSHRYPLSLDWLVERLQVARTASSRSG